MAAPGRSCPGHYRYRPESFARAPELRARTLLVVGGLYGNPFALEAALALAEAEGATLVFNGDFHWFDREPERFAAIDDAVLRHVALRGNVETEIAGDDESAGCGCAYPDWVGDAEVARSNAILARLRRTVQRFPQRRRRLAQLPMTLVAEVAGERIAICHGDAQSLAGWSFSQESLRDHPERAARLIERAGARIFACTHTCLPVMQELATARGPALVANNGAAGMPNFRGTHFGLATRIAGAASSRALYGTRFGAVYVEAMPLEYDHERWHAEFDGTWPEGSPAALSYRARILWGPAYEVRQALRLSLPYGVLARAA